jgi:hypothetical protein
MFILQILQGAWISVSDHNFMIKCVLLIYKVYGNLFTSIIRRIKGLKGRKRARGTMRETEREKGTKGEQIYPCT